MPVFVGCDLGTMGTKAGVVDEDGTILADAFEEVPLRYPRPGCVKQNLAHIEASGHRTVRLALQRSGRQDVQGVAFSGQMSGIGSIDSSFEPATYYDSWLDTRCEPYIRRMTEDAERVTAVSGCPPTYSHGPKILWWQHERPEDFRRILRFVTPSAYVAGRLVGLPAERAYIDRTYLHFTNLADNAASAWSEELIEAFGVDVDKLPRIVDPLDIVGTVTAQGSADTGLPAGTPVAAGAGDTAASVLGGAVVEPGQGLDVAGTASVLAFCLGRFAPDPRRRLLMASQSVIPGQWIALAFVNGGGLALRWFRDTVAAELAGRPDAYETLDREAAAVDPGSGGLLWCPHLQGRVLPPSPHVRGGWVGLTSGHGRAHMYRALLEGIAYEYALWADSVRDAAAGASLREVLALSGGARSRVWNAIKADVLGIAWVPLARQEAGVLGDALVAAAATGHADDVADTARAWQRTGERVDPDHERHARYQPYLTAYRLLSGHLDEIFEELGRASSGYPSDQARARTL
ncbi:MAG: xylulokinase [Streptosporangiaceae bacterium]